MKYTALSISSQLARLVPFHQLSKGDTPVFLPFYHVVSDERLPHIKNYPYRDTKAFRNELDFILKHYQPATLQEVQKGLPQNKKYFHLSFDDGLRECAEVVAPILKAKGIPATFFVNTGFVDNKALFHRYKASLILNELEKGNNKFQEDILAKNHFSKEKLLQITYAEKEKLDQLAKGLHIDFEEFLKTRQPYLSTSQILGLKKDGFTIGAHSVDHPEFWLLTEQEQWAQVKQSMDWVKKHVKPEILAFAFPYTDHGVKASLIKRLYEEGVCQITFGTAGIKKDQFLWHFQRFACESGKSIELQLKAELVYYYLRKKFGKETVKHP